MFDSVFSIVIFAAWLIRFFERTLFHAHLWQLKEYRWDRYRAHLLTRDGAWMLLHPWFLLGCVFFIASLFPTQLFGAYPASLRGMLLVSYGSLGWIFFSGVSVIVRLFRRQLQRPDATTRVALVITGVVGAVGLLFVTTPSYRSQLVLPSLLATPLVTALLVAASSIPANAIKRRTIEKAKTKMATLSNVKVIGITGSYGKSSTKEFLGQILSKKFKVVRTPKNRNSEIGIAETVLNDVNTEHEVFIVEMGAYRQGEIKAICDIVHPSIGVLTAVNEQHLSLFGSLQIIRETKYELIEALPESGTAIFNADNRITRELAARTLRTTKLYSLERPADVTASNIVVQPERISFSVQTKTEKQHFIVPLLGGFHVTNVLAAIAVAQTLGLSLKDIAEAAATIALPEHTMAPVHHPSGALIIDDAYSANPDGVLGALAHMKLIPRQYKVLVMLPMIELGAAAKEAHRKVGEHAGEICDLVILTRGDYASTIRYASKLPKEKVVVLTSPSAIVYALHPYLNANSVILLENRVSSHVLTTLMPQSS